MAEVLRAVCINGAAEEEDRQPILWFAPKGPTLIWYEDDAFERKERWGA